MTRMGDRPLHILMTDHHLGGGGQVRYVSNLATEFTRMGHTVVVGCRAGSVLLTSAEEAGCEAHDQFIYKGGLRPRVWIKDLKCMRRYIRERDPDIIHVSGSQDHWISGLGNWTMGRPKCVVRTRHNTYKVSDNWPNQWLNQKLTDYQIVVCDVVRCDLAKQPTFDGERMCSIHNGVDAEAYAPDDALRKQARQEFGYDDNHVVFGIAARLVKAKGHEFLIKSAAQLKDSYPQMRILALGQGDLRPDLEQLVSECGLGDMVQFAGFRDDMVTCTQAFDIGILPSIDCDTSSFSLKEEMAAEKPIIASDYGGLTEIVTDGVEGLIAEAGTVAPLASAMRRLLDDAELRQRMGVAGRKRVLREFTVQVFAERTIEAYRRAMTIHQERQGVSPS